MSDELGEKIDTPSSKGILLRIDKGLKKDIEMFAKQEGLSVSGFIRKALTTYIRKKYYEKVDYLLNFEDRIATGVLTELLPELEEIKSRIEEISGMPNQTTEDKPDEVIYPEDVKEEQDFPKVPGLHYKVDGENVVYEDGSIYNLHLGAWLVTKEDVAKWKRKKEKERWGL